MGAMLEKMLLQNCPVVLKLLSPCLPLCRWPDAIPEGSHYPTPPSVITFDTRGSPFKIPHRTLQAGGINSRFFLASCSHPIPARWGQLRSCLAAVVIF